MTAKAIFIIFLSTTLISCKATDVNKQCALKEKVFKKIFLSEEISMYLKSERYPILIKENNCAFENKYFYNVKANQIEIYPGNMHDYFFKVYEYNMKNGQYPENYNFIEEVKYLIKEDTIHVELAWYVRHMDIHAKLLRRNSQLEVVNVGFYIIN